MNKFIAALSIALTVWVGASFFEIISKNTSPNPEYSECNVFELLEDLADN